MTAFEKRLARSSARYREAPRIRLIRRLGRPGAAASWMGANAVQRASSGPSTQLHEGGPDPSPARTEDPGRRAVSLWLRLLGAHNLILREVRRGMGGAATLPQFDVLAQLDREPSGLVLGELPKRLMVSAGNLTPIVDRLVDDGYITRTPSNLDRRVQIICMTVEGRKAFRRMAKSHGSWLALLLAEFPAERLDGLIADLDELKGAVRGKLQRT